MIKLDDKVVPTKNFMITVEPPLPSHTNAVYFILFIANLSKNVMGSFYKNKLFLRVFRTKLKATEKKENNEAQKQYKIHILFSSVGMASPSPR